MTILSFAVKEAVFLFPLLMIVAGAGDVMTRRIPNRLSVGMCLAFFPLAAAAGFPLWLMGLHIATAVVLLLIGFGLFSFGILGGGDAKLIAAAGLWLGFPAVLPFIVFSALVGGILAAGIGVWFMLEFEMGQSSARAGRMLRHVRPDVPYAFALAAGAILATPYSWMMQASGA